MKGLANRCLILFVIVYCCLYIFIDCYYSFACQRYGFELYSIDICLDITEINIIQKIHCLDLFVFAKRILEKRKF